MRESGRKRWLVVAITTFLLINLGVWTCHTGATQPGKEKRQISYKDPRGFSVVVPEVPGAIQMVPWRDPNEGAFTVNVPYGWSIFGGLARPYVDAGIKLVLISGDKGIHVENPYPPMYTTPNMALAFAGFAEGSRYNPSMGLAQDMIVMSERSAEDYIRTILPSQLGISLQNVMPRSDIAGKVPRMPWTTMTTAAEGTLVGDGKIHKTIVVEQGMNMAGTGMWAVALVHYWGPEKEIALVESVVDAMAGSFRVDPNWAAREQAEVAKRTGIIFSTGSEIADMISSTFEYQSRVHDKASRQFSQAILGVQEVYDPKTGIKYEVPSGAEHYWSDGYNIVGTKVSEPPTYRDNWRELLPVE